MNDDRDLLAAEYALGTLAAAERDVAARLRASDPTFEHSVVDWQRRLSALNDGTAPVSPSATVWERIVARLGSEPGREATLPGNVTVLRRSVSRWRAAAVVTSALAASLALFVADREVLRPAPTSGGATYVAAVNRGGDMPALIVRVDLATHAVTVRPIEAETPPGKDLQLWFIASGQAPKSMGLVGRDRARMPMPADMPMDGGAFAVSVEPTGGSPTGAPTGPVVYKGMLIPE